jgi:hypothetical protein
MTGLDGTHGLLGWQWLMIIDGVIVRDFLG